MRFPDDVPTLTDGTVTLRAHHEGDVEALYEQATDPLMRQWTTVPVPSSLDDARRFATQVVPGAWRAGTGWGFAVEFPDDAGVPRFCGTVELRDEGHGRAEIAYGAHPWARGRGVMVPALNLLLDWGFGKLGLRTVIWWAHRGNWASRKVAWRLGFSFDGTVRRWMAQRGELYDGWVGALLSSDPREPRTTWLEAPRIVGEKVVLRAHRPGDAVRVQEACDDQRTAWWLHGMPSPYTRQDAEAFLETRKEHLAAGTAISWAVADPANEDLVGNISLFDIEPGHEAEIGYWTHPAARGRGVMSEACALVVRHAFVPVADGGQGLRRLKILAAEGNTASRHVAEASGFVQVGRERSETRLRDGSLVDTVVYDMLVSEYSPALT